MTTTTRRTWTPVTVMDLIRDREAIANRRSRDHWPRGWHAWLDARLDTDARTIRATQETTT